MSKKQQKQVVTDFINNKVQHLIATDCLRAGFDSQNCRVVVQGAGGCSVIEVLQEAYRGSRILPEERQLELGVTPKTHFVLVDIWDRHNPILEGMSTKRKAIYEKEGWKCHIVSGVDKIEWEPKEHKL